MTINTNVISKRYAILIGAEISGPERAAVNDLVQYVGEMVGMRPRVYRGQDSVAGVEEDAAFVVGTPASNALVARLCESADAGLSVKGLGAEGFAVQGAKLDGKPLVALIGETPIGAMYATSTYLERQCGVGFFNDGDRVPQLGSLPVAGFGYKEKPRFGQRIWFHHAVWTRPYDRSFQIWGFEDWKMLVDWMRRKRLNQLLLFHDEGTYLWGDAIFRAFPKIPKNGETLQHFTMLPEYRTELNQRIFRYARENGVQIGYNLFYSQVPDFFSEYYPDLKYHQLQMGNLGICASTPECEQFMFRYWEEILDLYGVDDVHAYHVCPYQHEARLCEHFQTRAEPTRQAYKVLQALDPKARMYMESWCWYYGHEPGKNPQQALDEWDELQQLVPPEVGVHDWDRVVRPWKPKMRPGGQAFDWYKPRDWISLHHLTMEMAWPPDYGWHELEKSVKAIRIGADNGAIGIAAFHILARTNELPAFVFAEMAWAPDRPQEELVKEYLAHRFRADSVAALEKSFEAHFEAATSDACLFGVGGLSVLPTEMELVDRISSGGRGSSGSWAAERLKDFAYRYDKTKEALALAQSVSANEQGNPFFERYLWELDYLMNRWYGIIEFFRAYRADTSPVAASEHYQHALHAFYRIRTMFRDDEGIKMGSLQEMAPEVKWNPSFLENWHLTFGREYDDHRVRHHNVVWELFPEYEARLLSMDPAYVDKKD